ncbi:hypothetical protein GCM10011586_25850 [Silvibacterium dinghuense]|nr:hypothetical protein GCM10011586_25850 [Silvibacterium dinghuense]
MGAPHLDFEMWESTNPGSENPANPHLEQNEMWGTRVFYTLHPIPCTLSPTPLSHGYSFNGTWPRMWK